MLRRVARALRRLLFVLGMATLALLVLDCFCDIVVFTTWPRDQAHASLRFGAISLYCEYTPGFVVTNPPIVGQLELHEVYVWFPLPEYEYFSPFGQSYVKLPLWLLATLFLAWPVTSFIVHRRRHKRGFEVEAKAGSVVSTADA